MVNPIWSKTKLGVKSPILFPGRSLEPVGNNRPRLMVTTLCFMKYKTRLMVYFGYSAPANRRWQIAIALFGEQRVVPV